MRTARLFLILSVMLALCPISSHATNYVEVTVSPPAPTDVDDVVIEANGCTFACTLTYADFSCGQLDAHNYVVNALNFGVFCFPPTEECFPCEGCATSLALGQHHLGVLAPGHYVVHVGVVVDMYNTTEAWDVGFDVTGTPTGVRPTPSASFISVAPNPFASSANIALSLSKHGRATLDIFDVRGSRVRTLLNEAIDAPEYTLQWDGRDGSGRQQPSGVYFARLTLDGAVIESRRIVLLR